ncbi:TonB-dependent receptor [Paucibacter sp. APW11]|uniref:TonB-dependent receptor n=1 Tax=Roseateles aquae TaxID=3077235 RepID=A0ABU3PF10_9BURK|nr:TonB-dependent receptor [Paucibacter sp. APW11]MDT9001136.1 TonB-dependent receptor [Paucibacter sp. APW11]
MNKQQLSLTQLASALALAFVGAAPALAQTSEVQELERVTITTGRGQLRSVQGLTKAEFENAISGTSPLATVSRLPGVNFQSADALGNYEWSTRFTVRAFSQNQLGFTLDDVPLGDMSYGNLNGLHISRAISSENVARATLSQGAGSLDTASSSNLGGTLQFYSARASDKFGVQAAQTVGSDSNRRSYVRIDSGTTGIGQFYASYTHQNAEKWKGHGEQRQQQLNLKYENQFGAKGEHSVSAFVNTSKRREIDYQDMSLAMIDRLGYHWDNFYPDFSAAITASNNYCGNVAGKPYTAQCDDAYYAGSGLRDDTLAGVTVNTQLTEQLRLKLTGYRHNNDGRGLWYTPYVSSPDANPASPNKTPISLRTTEYAIKRNGLVATLDLELGMHQFKFGYWHEGNDFDQARRFYATTPTAVPSPYDFPSNPFFTQWQYGFTTKTDQFSVADAITLSKQLTLGLGFKSLRVNIDGNLLVDADKNKPSGSISANKGFLPQVGLNYQLSASDELFASVSRNMRAYQGAATGTTPFATTAAGFAAIKSSLRPETSDNFEAGWRTQGKLYEGALTAYVVNFKDRLLGVQVGSGIQGNPTVLSNVGGVRTLGLEGALSFRLAPGFSWYNSLSLTNSTYRNDVVSNGVAVATSGKHVTDAPNTMLKSIFSYDQGSLFGSAGMDFMSKRYYTYLNDGSVPSRTLFNVSGGWRLKNIGGFLSEGSLQAGVTNLFDKKYISTIGSNGFVNSDPKGNEQTLLTGAPRQFFITFSAKL